MTATKERPVIFAAESVRAILAGRKSQTRRVIRGVFDAPGIGPCVKDWDGGPSALALAPDDWEICPHGTPKCRLWVKETFALAIRAGDSIHGERVPHYRADGHTLPRWQSPLFMPRWASRLTLGITGVKVERLASITEADALAEGCEADDISKVGVPCFSARQRFRERWDEINGKRGHPWASSPWVWAVTFRVVAPG